MIKAGYKVTDPDMCSSVTIGEARVQYRMNKFVKRKFGFGPLLVIENFSDAIDYIKSQVESGGKPQWMRLFVCIYETSKKDMVWEKKFDKQSGIHVVSVNKVYPGTIAAKRVKLFYEISPTTVSILVSARSKRCAVR